MSVIGYRCNFCGCQMNKHKNVYSNYVYINRPLHNNPNSDSICFSFKMGTNQDGSDICENCADSIKKEALT